MSLCLDWQWQARAGSSPDQVCEGPAAQERNSFEDESTILAVRFPDNNDWKGELPSRFSNDTTLRYTRDHIPGVLIR